MTRSCIIRNQMLIIHFSQSAVWTSVALIMGTILGLTVVSRLHAPEHSGIYSGDRYLHILLSLNLLALIVGTISDCVRSEFL
mgnify:CR=1 FL=1